MAVIKDGGDGRFLSVFVQPYVLSSVRKAEQKIVEAQLNHEYAGIEGKRLTQKRIRHAGNAHSSRQSV
jgi:aspartate/tyrosine/aromatic aminotransferase